ncbi:hypothetical protein ACIQPP_05485 [Streptomyces violaceusniger]|uniref:hypothetical protein n=1 Tax=Streptomyces violaceusniger TaxID=68280 RepID=UPI00099837B7|nr:hypothetical protein [Streptomyces hygroscopicus]AQW55273.1 hypothetical protein SHXM_08736 [Streptomyces hygroscopicus]
MSDPISPSRIIPAGQPIPAAPPLLQAPPGATNLPPWRTAAAPPPPPPPPAAPQPVPAPPPGPIEHHVIIKFAPPEPEPEVEPELGRWARMWEAITTRVKPWQALVALGAAAVPMPWTGYSAATTWAYVMHEARGMHVGFGYSLAFGTFAFAVRRFTAHRGVVALWATAVTSIGIFGATDWYDAVVVITGVRR